MVYGIKDMFTRTENDYRGSSPQQSTINRQHNGDKRIVGNEQKPEPRIFEFLNGSEGVSRSEIGFVRTPKILLLSASTLA